VKHRQYHSNISFLDLFLNTLLGFVFLFLIAWLLINPESTKKAPQPKAEFLITVNWPDQSDDDIDLWVEDPNENLVYYGKKDSGLMHLDRDDLGKSSDRIVKADGSVDVISINREVLTIRGIAPGEYTVNLHVFRKNDSLPTEAEIEVIKINPYVIVHKSKVTLTEWNEEITVIRFTVNADGAVVNTNRLQKNLTLHNRFNSARQ
jgi:hypothetical protein